MKRVRVLGAVVGLGLGLVGVVVPGAAGAGGVGAEVGAEFEAGALYYRVTHHPSGNILGTVEVIKHPSYVNLTKVTIPPIVEYENGNYYVTAIGDRAFQGCGRLRLVEGWQALIHQVDHNGNPTFISIGHAAFSGSGLVFSELADPARKPELAGYFGGIRTIGDSAFALINRGVDSLVIDGEFLQRIGERAFAFGGDPLKKIPGWDSYGITEGGEWATVYFEGSGQPSTVDMRLSKLSGDNIRTNRYYGGRYGSTVKRLYLPNTLTAIPDYAFGGRVLSQEESIITGSPAWYEVINLPADTCLQFVVLPPGLQTIGLWAFCGCTNLSETNLHELPHLTFIDVGAFRNTQIGRGQTLTIPPSVTEISRYAFYGTHYDTVVIQARPLHNIGTSRGVFDHMPYLKTVKFATKGWTSVSSFYVYGLFVTDDVYTGSGSALSPEEREECTILVSQDDITNYTGRGFDFDDAYRVSPYTVGAAFEIRPLSPLPTFRFGVDRDLTVVFGLYDHFEQQFVPSATLSSLAFALENPDEAFTFTFHNGSKSLTLTPARPRSTAPHLPGADFALTTQSDYQGLRPGNAYCRLHYTLPNVTALTFNNSGILSLFSPVTTATATVLSDGHPVDLSLMESAGPLEWPTNHKYLAFSGGPYLAWNQQYISFNEGRFPSPDYTVEPVRIVMPPAMGGESFTTIIQVDLSLRPKTTTPDPAPDPKPFTPNPLKSSSLRAASEPPPLADMTLTPEEIAMLFHPIYLGVENPHLETQSSQPFQVKFIWYAYGLNKEVYLPEWDMTVYRAYLRPVMLDDPWSYFNADDSRTYGTFKDFIDLNAVTGHADDALHTEHWNGTLHDLNDPNPLFHPTRNETMTQDADGVITVTRYPGSTPALDLNPHKDHYARIRMNDYDPVRYPLVLTDKWRFADTEELSVVARDEAASDAENRYTGEAGGYSYTYRVTAPQTTDGYGLLPGAATLLSVSPEVSSLIIPSTFTRTETFERPPFDPVEFPFTYRVTAIEAGAFAGAENLRRVKFLHREGLPEVPEDAFMAWDGAGAPKAVYTSYELLPALAEVAAFETWVQEAAYAVVGEEGGPKAEVDLGYSSREVSIPWRLRDNFAGEYVSTEGHVTEVRAGEAFGETFSVGAGNPVTVTSPHALLPATYEASLTVADILPPVPLAIKVQTLPPAAVTMSLTYDATLMPVTARIRASVLFDGEAPYAPEDITLAWHQDGAGKLRLEPEAGGWTVLVNSVDSGFGRMWCTLPEVWGGVKSPELAFYTPVSHLGKWPPTLVEGRIIVFEGQKQLPLSSRLRLREGETKYLYARVATNIPGEYNQHQTLLSLNLKWECISDLVTVAKTLDGTYAITPKPGSGGGGAGGKLVITVNADPTLPNLPAPVGLRSSGGGEAPVVSVEPAEVSFIILKGAVVEEETVEPEGETEGEEEPVVEEGEPEVVEEGEPEVEAEPEPEGEPEAVEPEEEELVVEGVTAPPVGTLEVVGGEEESYTVYTLSGRAVSEPLKAGLYIVKGGGRVGKVVR